MIRWIQLAAFAGVVVLSILVGGYLRMVFAPEWLPTEYKTETGGTALRPWAVEADCYSQLARVQRILHGQGLVQNHFKVENWPEGLTPSTTAPFDYVIIAVYLPLTLFVHYPLDWAGALVSPVIWLAVLAFFIGMRTRCFTLAGKTALVVGASILPPLIWATAFGHVRHHSMILALLAVALVAEYERWEKDAPRRWHIAAGLVWGLLCWTSLYEPLFVVLMLGLFNWLARKRETAAFGISFGAMMLLALLIEGVHVYIPPAEVQPVLQRWLSYVAEMTGMSFPEFINAITFSSPGPFLLPQVTSFVFLAGMAWVAFCLWRGRNMTDRFILGLAIFLAIFTFYERRWFAYSCLSLLFLGARYIQQAPLNWTRLAFGAVFLINVTWANYISILVGQQLPPNQPSEEMAKLSHAIDAPGGILAPWWISPGLLYFSGQPIVSGSSHCGITGIEASAEFFASISWQDAEEILKERKVRWVVVWDEPKYVYPLLQSSQKIMGEPISTEDAKGNADLTIAQVLITDRDVPDQLQLRAMTQHLKLYEYVPAGTGGS